MSNSQLIQRILFATDFSDPSENARKYASEVASLANSELHLLHVVVPLAVPAMGAPSVGYIEDTDAIAASVKQSEQDLERLLDPEWRSSHRVVSAVVVGTPVFEILKYAKDHHIDLIVMGTYGRTGLTHMLMGSVAENVVRKAHCPVLTVHQPKHSM
jgi:universal stress protein A